jgi:hypothetical protein
MNVSIYSLYAFVCMHVCIDDAYMRFSMSFDTKYVAIYSLSPGIGKKGKKNKIVYPGRPEGRFSHTLTRDTLTRLKQSTPSP